MRLKTKGTEKEVLSLAIYHDNWQPL